MRILNAGDKCTQLDLNSKLIGDLFLIINVFSFSLKRRVDEPAVEERHDGRSFQQRERIVHAGDAPCRERILGEPTDAVLL